MVIDNRDTNEAEYRDMKPAKAMTIRLSAEQAEALDAVAAVEDRPVAEVIRTAIAAHIESRRRDRTFQDSLRDRINRTKRMLGGK